MNPTFAHHLRSRLERRLEDVLSADSTAFDLVLASFWRLIHSEPTLRAIAEELVARFPKAAEWADSIRTNFDQPDTTSEAVFAAMAYHVVKAQVEQGGDIRAGLRMGAPEEMLEHFRQVYARGLARYLVDGIDDRSLTVTLLKRYKTRCEWFTREQLAPEDPLAEMRERNMLKDFCLYLHDQGVDFVLEPQGPTGRPDVLALRVGEERMVVEAKLCHEALPHRIGVALGQLHDYMRDLDETRGYLLVYNGAPQDVSVELSGTLNGLPYLDHDNKQIFVLVVDLTDPNKRKTSRRALHPARVTLDKVLKEIEPAEDDDETRAKRAQRRAAESARDDEREERPLKGSAPGDFVV